MKTVKERIVMRDELDKLFKSDRWTRLRDELMRECHGLTMSESILLCSTKAKSKKESAILAVYFFTTVMKNDPKALEIFNMMVKKYF